MPLEYAVPDSDHATVALIKLPAPKKILNEIKDPILLNPGMNVRTTTSFSYR